MNPEFPPLTLAQPFTRARKPEKAPFPKLPDISIEQRTHHSQRLRADKDRIVQEMRALTPDQKRAVFLKLRHDRPLKKEDLGGTGLVLMAPSGDKESLVIPRKGDLEQLDQRLKDFGEDTKPGRPKGTDFATKVESINVADPKDRLSPEFASDFNKLIAEDFVIYEIEVSSFANRPATRKREVARTMEEIREFLGATEGRVYETDFAGAGARAVLSSTGTKLHALVVEPRWWQRIVLFDKRPHFQTLVSSYQNFSVTDSNIGTPPADAETICVVDTGIAAANPFLKGVLRADISRSFVTGCLADTDAADHGSGVASLAAYYQLDITTGGTNIASAFVVSARITNDKGELDTPYFDDEGIQRVREARLLSNILRDVVQHFRPHGVRLFVLSFSIFGHIWSQATKPFVPRNSWVARTIDQLSRDHDVVFVTITGNVLSGDVEVLHGEQAYPEYLAHPWAKILDPGQAALAVTAGSIAQSERVAVDPAVPMARENQPSPFTRTGPGFADAIKPDFVERGGNLVIDTAKRVCANIGTNVITASGKLTPPLQHGNGTSYAAPRVANHLATILRDLRTVVGEPSAPLLRAFLALSSQVSSDPPFADVDKSLKCTGYGLPDAIRATECAQHSVVLFYEGELLADQVALFRVPVPIEIRDSGRVLKRITVSTASAPPVQPWGVAEYLGAKMKFRLFRGDKPVEDIIGMMQREDAEENLASKLKVEDIRGKLGIQRRSVGTLQRDIFEWNDHDPAFSTNDYILAVSLAKASWWKDEPANVPIGIGIRIEDSSGLCQQLYAQVRARIQARVRASA